MHDMAGLHSVELSFVPQADVVLRLNLNYDGITLTSRLKQVYLYTLLRPNLLSFTAASWAGYDHPITSP